jgi:hypothetical protein
VPFRGIFSEVSLDSNVDPPVDNFNTTNTILKEAISDKGKFYELYEVLLLIVYLT